MNQQTETSNFMIGTSSVAQAKIISMKDSSKSRIVLIGLDEKELSGIRLTKKTLPPKTFLQILQKYLIKNAEVEAEELNTCKQCLEAQEEKDNWLDCRECHVPVLHIEMIIAPKNTRKKKYLALVPKVS